MAQCPHCGAPANGKFCPNCGTQLMQPPVPPYAPPFAPAPRPSRPVWPWIAGGAALVLVLVLLLVAALGDEPPPPRPAAHSGGSTPAPKSEPAAPAPAKKPGAGAYYVGRWRCWSFGGGSCPVGWEQLLIKEDGSYTLAGVPGKWRAEGEKAVFSGPLEFAGPAAPYEQDQFKFDYVDKSGFGTYILFVKW
ncbi:MAG TPA: hypothetical protein VD969_25975 [Symbiobacteriaceae bacterium]|nr:hypothetical protein [Symbiobacteriaceae bacterium]